MNKQYIGDSVYVVFDGYGIWLTTENGHPNDPRNKIYLEPVVQANLDTYKEYLKRKYEKKEESEP